MKFKVFIRVDGSSILGLGHLMRCYALAQMLTNDFEVSFYSIEMPLELNIDFIKKGFDVKIIDSEQKFLDIIDVEKIIVLDGYKFDDKYQAIIKGKCKALVCIDDLITPIVFADLIINHSFHADVSDYNLAKCTKLALGPQYALLQPVFLNRNHIHPNPETSRKLFICFGGADPKNLTYAMLRIALKLNIFSSITIVTGASYNYERQLKDYIKDKFNVIHFHAIRSDKMFELMEKTDIGLVPASGILYELMSLNKIIVTGMYIDNQRLFLDGVKNIESIISCGNFDDLDCQVALTKAVSLKRKAKSVFDGKSGERILSLFKAL